MISKKSRTVMDYFDEILPNAACELVYHKDYELLIAVMLSAQTTDKKVNEATEKLFGRYPTLDELKNASVSDVEEIIKPLGLFHNKAINAIGIAKELSEKYNYSVPQERDVLTTLPGVGRKTANVVIIELFGGQEFPVDTHINRIGKRLGYAEEDADVLEVEMKLRKAFPKEKYSRLHHQFIHFGRYFCSSRNPKCEGCKLKEYCNYPK